MGSRSKDDEFDRKLRKAFKITLVTNILYWIAVLCLLLICHCGSCTGKSSKSTKKAAKKQLESVQLLYNNIVTIECGRVKQCDFTMADGHYFKMTGIKLKGVMRVVPVGKKPKKEKKKVSIRLKGDPVSIYHTKMVRTDDIRRAKSEHFTFKTPYGEVKAIIRARAKGSIANDLCGYAGKNAHVVLDASGSMQPVRAKLWPIVEKALKECRIKLSGLTWYANLGDVWDSKLVTNAALSNQIENDRVIRTYGHVAEAPSPALEHVAKKFKPGVIILISDEGAQRGGKKPNTRGIPVYAIALGEKSFCKEDLKAIAKFTRGKMKYMDPVKDLGMRPW